MTGIRTSGMRLAFTRVWGAGVVAALALLFPGSADAQGPPAIDLGVGYQYIRANEPLTYPLGVNADVSGRLYRALRWVGEVGYGMDRQADDELGFSSTDSAFHYAAGVRFAPGGGRWPWVQVLGGRQRDGFTLKADDVGTLIDESQTTAIVQPGIGYAFSLGRWRVFAQADYRRVLYASEPEHDVRGVVGLRFKLR